MANEITKVELFGYKNDGDPISLTIASSAVITKGTLMDLSDPRTTAAATTIQEPISGIAAMGKSADWSTRISVWQDGVFEGVASGAITAGSKVASASDANYPNTLMTTIGLTVPASGAEVVGVALETAADAEKFTFRRMGIGG